MFSPLPDKPDHNALELAILELWQRDDTFGRLRAKNADGPKFRFTDGPVTANKKLALHTAWGRTLKDVFQRYKAMQGFHQRYQNGFDCQGLWIEVGVEKELGLNSKHEIEEYGLEEFARKCRSVVERYAAELTDGSIRLGQWMDWGNDYFTFSDTNIEYIWRFLKIVHERNWLYRGHRSTEWCPRCGTSISAHELAGSYIEKEDPSLTVRFPLIDRPGEAVVIWTTTPWTLPANVAAAVRADADYGRLPNGDWIAVARKGANDEFVETLKGADLVDWPYTGPFDHMAGSAAGKHRVVAWDEVALDEGTGHRSHRARLRHRRLRARQGRRPRRHHARGRVRPLLPGVRLAGRARCPRSGRRHHQRPARARPAHRRRHHHPPLSRMLALPHAADLPHLRRLVHRR